MDRPYLGFNKKSETRQLQNKRILQQDRYPKSYGYADDYFDNYALCNLAGVQFRLAQQQETQMEQNTNRFKLFPNPSDGTFNIRWSGADNANAQIKLYDIAGRLIETFKFSGNEAIISLPAATFAEGIYFAELYQFDEKYLQREKLIIKH